MSKYGFEQFQKFLYCEDFDFLGYPNVMKYPLDFWKIKLHDNIVREHFYKLKLYRKPLFDLQDITYMFNEEKIGRLEFFTDIFEDGMYLSGGSIISILIGRNVNDLDIFVVGNEDEN